MIRFARVNEWTTVNEAVFPDSFTSPDKAHAVAPHRGRGRAAGGAQSLAKRSPQPGPPRPRAPTVSQALQGATLWSGPQPGPALAVSAAAHVHTALSSPAENTPGPAWAAVLGRQDWVTPVAEATKPTWMRALFGFFLSKLPVGVRSHPCWGLRLSPAKIPNLWTYSQPGWVLLLETCWVPGGEGLWWVITVTTDNGHGIMDGLSLQRDNSQTVCDNRILTHSLAASSQEASPSPLQPPGQAVRIDPLQLWRVLSILSSQGKAEKLSVPQTRHTRCPHLHLPCAHGLPQGTLSLPPFTPARLRGSAEQECWWPTPPW